jgi:hypothetical protein
LHRNQIYFARKHFGIFYAGYVSGFTVIMGLARMLIAGDNWHQFRLRLAAVREGWRMALPKMATR